MTWQIEPFRRFYRQHVGTIAASNSYVSFLNHLDRLSGGLDERLARLGAAEVIEWIDRQPADRFNYTGHAGNCRSAIRCYVRFLEAAPTMASKAVANFNLPASSIFVPDEVEIRHLLREARELGARYYRLTGKPLGVTGEVAELEAAEKLGLTLLPARQAGHDAVRTIEGVVERVQIKGRAVDRAQPYKGRCPSIKCGNLFDVAMLVLLDRTTLQAFEIWQATEAAIVERLGKPGSKARNERKSLAITQFKSIAVQVWAG